MNKKNIQNKLLLFICLGFYLSTCFAGLEAVEYMVPDLAAEIEEYSIYPIGWSAKGAFAYFLLFKGSRDMIGLMVSGNLIIRDAVSDKILALVDAEMDLNLESADDNISPEMFRGIWDKNRSQFAAQLYAYAIRQEGTSYYPVQELEQDGNHYSFSFTVKKKTFSFVPVFDFIGFVTEDAVHTAFLDIHSPELGSKTIFSMCDSDVENFVSIEDLTTREEYPPGAPCLDFRAKGYCRSPFEKRIIIIYLIYRIGGTGCMETSIGMAGAHLTWGFVKQSTTTGKAGALVTR